MEGNVFEQAPRSERIDWRQAMQAPEDVQAMLKLASLGWGAKRIANELGCHRRCDHLRRAVWAVGFMAFTPEVVIWPILLSEAWRESRPARASAHAGR